MGKSRRFHVLAGWLAIVFLLGGSSRADLATLPLLRPLALFVLAYALATLSIEDFKRNRAIVALSAGWLGLILLQLVPLPPALWQSLGDRDIIREIGDATKLGDDIWRPLSLAPFATLNAFWASLVPASILALGIGLDREDVLRLVPTFLVIAFTSLFVGMLQIAGPSRGMLYFYRYVHSGLPVGLLANRNHQAVLLACAIPALTLWITSRNRNTPPGRSPLGRWLPIFGGTTVLMLTILLTGSRSGTVIGMVGLVAAGAMLLDPTGRSEMAQDRSNPRALWAGLFLGGMAVMVGLAMSLGRAFSIDRVSTTRINEETRMQILPTVMSMVETYFPWGIGIGSFQAVFRMHEPDRLLRAFYVNQAHNDWLDLALTGGLPALILLAALFIFLARNLPAAISGARTPDQGAARLGFVLVVMLGMASVTDYTLRVPSMACLGALALLWINMARLPRGKEVLASAKV